jgi:hypothetical protein
MSLATTDDEERRMEGFLWRCLGGGYNKRGYYTNFITPRWMCLHRAVRFQDVGGLVRESNVVHQDVAFTRDELKMIYHSDGRINTSDDRRRGVPRYAHSYRKWFCSELVTAALVASGFVTGRVHPGLTSPNALERLLAKHGRVTASDHPISKM